jgi:hypothetical protein
MAETVFIPITVGDDDEPISKDGIEQLVAASLAAVGHANALRYLSDQIEAAFERGDTHEVSRITDLLEFTTLELQDAAEKAECLARGWGNCQRRAKKHGAKPETEPPAG